MAVHTRIDDNELEETSLKFQTSSAVLLTS